MKADPLTLHNLIERALMAQNALPSIGPASWKRSQKPAKFFASCVPFCAK
jgi:hypothetical protein